MTPSGPANGFPPVPWSAWRERVLTEIGGEEKEGRLRRPTLEGIPREPLYSPDHPGLASPGGPALPRPFRAPGPWRIWQEVPAGAGSAGTRALRGERERDLGGLWIRAGRVGSEQLAVHHVTPLLASAGVGARVHAAIEGDGDPLPLAAVLLAAVRAAGVDPAVTGGCLGCDPLGGAARNGEAGGGACDQLVACARWAAEHAPGWRAAVVSGSPYHDAGADAVLELAFTLATGADTLRRLLAAGLPPDIAARQILLSLPVGRDFFVQVAKLRAARVLWGALLALHDAPPEALRLHARTAWRTKTRLDPATDLVRVTLEAMAAVVGGCDDLTCAPFLDPAVELELGLPLASATQLLLRDEAGLGAMLDPAGGSWYVESLTSGLAGAAWELFQEVERLGGMARALAVGAVANRVEEAAAHRRRKLARRRLALTGISNYPAPGAGSLPHRPRPAADGAGEAPSDAVVEGAGAALPPFAGAPGSPEILGAAIDAAISGAGVSALAAALPPGGEPLRAPPLDAWRDAVPYEGLRRLAESRAERPRAVLLRLAPVAATFAAADLARQLLMAGGIDVLEPEPLADPTEAGQVWRSVATPPQPAGGGAALLAAGVVVPGRRTPADEVLAACHALRAAGCEAVAVAGRRDDLAEGADFWLEERGDALELLEDLLGRLEVLV